MIQVQLKLKLRPAQERQLDRWLWHLSGVFNWAIQKIKLDAANGIYHGRYDLEMLLAGHGKKLGIPSHTIRHTVRTANTAWQRCFQGLSRRPRLKGSRNKLNSIPLPGLKPLQSGKFEVFRLGSVRFHAQSIPQGTIKIGRLIKRASGWYLCLVVDADPRDIPLVSNEAVGIDPGFSSLLTLSTGEAVEHPRELQATALRIAQAQRGRNRRLVARLAERQAHQRTDRNHKISRRIVAENALVVWSKDRHASLARSFGKSVASSAHGQLRQFLSYKCRSGGRQFVEVPSRNSTKTCSACLALTGPTGYAGLSVRVWTCSECGSRHDRDANAALNTLRLGRGMRLECASDRTPEIANPSHAAMSIHGSSVSFGETSSTRRISPRERGLNEPN